MKKLMMMCAVMASGFSYASAALENIEGYYVKNRSCDVESSILKQRKRPTESAFLKVKKRSNSEMGIDLGVTVLIDQNGLGPQPYSCDFNGIAKLKGNELIVLKDGEGYDVDGISIVIEKDKIKVIDKAEAEHAGYYCGAHVSLNGLVFMRKQKCPEN